MILRLYFPIPVYSTNCLKTSLPNVSVTIGDPLLLSCFQDCPKPDSWGFEWTKDYIDIMTIHSLLSVAKIYLFFIHFIELSSSPSYNLDNIIASTFRCGM